MFKYYISAFKNIYDFSSIAKRKDLNYFILSWVVITLLINICFGILYIFGDAVLAYFKMTGNSIYKGYSILLFWFNILNYIALIPLAKRRLNDLTQKYSNIIFVMLILAILFVATWPLWTRYILLPIMIKYSLPKIIHDIIMYFTLCCGLGTIITELTLMIKK